jgi:hypothetical protein
MSMHKNLLTRWAEGPLGTECIEAFLLRSDLSPLSLAVMAWAAAPMRLWSDFANWYVNTHKMPINFADPQTYAQLANDDVCPVFGYLHEWVYDNAIDWCGPETNREDVFVAMATAWQILFLAKPDKPQGTWPKDAGLNPASVFEAMPVASSSLGHLIIDCARELCAGEGWYEGRLLSLYEAGDEPRRFGVTMGKDGAIPCLFHRAAQLAILLAGYEGPLGLRITGVPERIETDGRIVATRFYPLGGVNQVAYVYGGNYTLFAELADREEYEDRAGWDHNQYLSFNNHVRYCLVDGLRDYRIEDWPVKWRGRPSPSNSEEGIIDLVESHWAYPTPPFDEEDHRRQAESYLDEGYEDAGEEE